MKDKEKIRFLNEIEDRKQILQDMFEARMRVKWPKNDINEKSNQHTIFI